MKIALVGGGTGGPLTPLLAVHEEIKSLRPQTEFLYFGGNSALENLLIKNAGLRNISIPAGKLRRYLSIKNFFALFLTFAGFFKALIVLARQQPSAIFCAGSYVSVPVAYAAKLLGIKIIIHQQDVVPSLTNTIIYPIADKLTVSLPESFGNFYNSSGLFKKTTKSKIILTGNPTRKFITKGSIKNAIEYFKLEPNFPTLLILSGGTGAKSLNEFIVQSVPELTRYFQIIHQTGNRGTGKITNPRYHAYSFLENELNHAFAIADFVISRAGFSTITEIIACKKISFLIPLPNSHQVQNADYFMKRGAAFAFSQSTLSTEQLFKLIRKLQFDWTTQSKIKQNLNNIFPNKPAKIIADTIIATIK